MVTSSSFALIEFTRNHSCCGKPSLSTAGLFFILRFLKFQFFFFRVIFFKSRHPSGDIRQPPYSKKQKSV